VRQFLEVVDAVVEFESAEQQFDLVAAVAVFKLGALANLVDDLDFGREVYVVLVGQQTFEDVQLQFVKDVVRRLALSLLCLQSAFVHLIVPMFVSLVIRIVCILRVSAVRVGVQVWLSEMIRIPVVITVVVELTILVATALFEIIVRPVGILLVLKIDSIVLNI